MATTRAGLTSLIEVGSFPITSSCSFPRYRRLVVFPRVNSYALVEPCSTVSIMINNPKNLPSFIVSKRTRIEGFRLFGSIELDRLLTTDDQDEMSEGFFEAIEELESMAREPSDVLEEMNNRLSPRELQLVLVYFSQEGRDSWRALEVFEWLQKENRVDKETMELMVSIMCGWAKKLIESDHVVGDVVDLLVDMDCVGLKPSFSMIEKVISLYWEMGKKEKGVLFVKEVLRRGIAYTVDDGESNKGGPIGYLAWRMMDDGDYHDAVKLVIDFRECGLKPEVYSYLIAMTALVKELKEFSNTLLRLKRSMKAGLVAELGVEDVWLIEKYQSDLLKEGVQLSNWVNEEGSTRHSQLVHERLLHMYVCAGRGIEAERQLWEMKLLGKQPNREIYDIVLAICASQKEAGAVTRLITGMEFASSIHRKKTLSLMLRGYVKGGHFEDASETLIKMLDMGLCPEFLDRVAVLQGVRKNLHRSGNFNLYLNLCKQLSDANLTSPCLLYLYIDQYKLWMINML